MAPGRLFEVMYQKHTFSNGLTYEARAQISKGFVSRKKNLKSNAKYFNALNLRTGVEFHRAAYAQNLLKHENSSPILQMLHAKMFCHNIWPTLIVNGTCIGF